MSNLFAVAGIVLVLIGTTWIVFAALRAPGLLMDAEFKFGAEHVIDVVDEARRKGWDTAPKETREAAEKRARAELISDRRELAARIAAQERVHRWAIIGHSLVGLTLVALGSISQGVAILLTPG